MTDKIQQARRAAFEAAMDAQDKNPGQWLGSSYSNPYGECSWIGFNAALDSLCIELPGDTCGRTDYDQGRDSGIEDCRAAIEQTNMGIQIK